MSMFFDSVHFVLITHLNIVINLVSLDNAVMHDVWHLVKQQLLVSKLLKGKSSAKLIQFLLFNIWIVGGRNEGFEENIKHGMNAIETQSWC